MKGIILAAGRGLRLNGATGNTPKCLLEVGGMTLLERQIRALRACAIDEIIVVTGYEAERVQRACDPDIGFVENVDYEQTNSLYSLWLTRKHLLDGFVVLNSDVLFDTQLLVDLVTARYEDALLIGYEESLAGRLGEEEMKVKVRSGRVVAISKSLSVQEADGENVGIVKFGAQGARLLVEHMNALIANGGCRDWAPRAFGEYAAWHSLYAIPTRGYAWIEIDFPRDYLRAVNEILPQLTAFAGAEKANASLSLAQPTGVAGFYS
jgi:L-glutamine-phosphate cytidylyltransferase